MAIKRKVKRSEEYEVVYLNDAFEEFIDEKEALNLSEASIRTYTNTYIKFCKFFDFDNDTITEDVTQQHIFKWIGTLKHDSLSINSINHYLRDMRTFLYWCMDEDRGYIGRFKIQMLTVQEEAPKHFSDEEIELLLDKPRKKDSFSAWRTWAIVNWVLGTGNRASTICNVKIGDIDFKRKEITLAHTKNNKAQIIPLSLSLETVLKEFIRMWHSDDVAEDYLFCNIGKEKLTTNALRLAFEKYCSDRAVEHTSIHGLRHNFAKGWIKNNGNIFVLQKILGHSTLEMTRKYVRLFGEDLKEDFTKYNPLDVIKRKQRRSQTVKKDIL